MEADKPNPTMKDVAQEAGVGYDGMRCFGDMEFYCSTIVQPLEEMAETCVNLVLTERSEKAPSLICLPVSYAYGGTTRQ